MSTSSNKTVPLTVSYQLEPLSKEQGIMYATILLLALYLLIIFEVSRLDSILHGGGALLALCTRMIKHP